MNEVEPLCQGLVDQYYLGVLSDADNRVVNFYQNLMVPWGNSYYLENEQLSLGGKAFDENSAVKKIAMTLDTVVEQRGYAYPDLIKLDVQGAELDIIKGATETLKTCKHLILELQVVEYNKGAPLHDEVINYLKTIGFVNSFPPALPLNLIRRSGCPDKFYVSSISQKELFLKLKIITEHFCSEKS